MPDSPWLTDHEQLEARIRLHPLYSTLVRRVADIEATHVYGRFGRRARFYTLNGATYFSALSVPSAGHAHDWKRAYRRADQLAQRMMTDVFAPLWPGGQREMRGALYHVARRDVDARRLGRPTA